MTAVYLAARYSRRLELCGYRDQLMELGITVTSRWLNGMHQLDDQGVPIGDNGERIFESTDTAVPKWRRWFAEHDRDDVLSADMLIAFTEEPRSGNSRGGRHVELGLALGSGKRVVVVGPRENVFCWLPQVSWFQDWPGALHALTDEAGPRDMQLATDGRYYPLGYLISGPEPS